MKLKSAILVVLLLGWGIPVARGEDTGSIEGVVSVGSTPLANIIVDLGFWMFPFQSTTTEADGTYRFDGVPVGDIDVSIVVPLGYDSENHTARVSVAVGETTLQDFELEALPDPGEARGFGYWKHQVNVHVWGQGQAQESYEDMCCTYPPRLFQFQTYPSHNVVVDGVTNGEFGGPHNLYTMRDMLTNWYWHEPRCKQELLVLLLNVVSNRLQTVQVISADGATVSQAIQQIAAQINDGDSSNDEAAKDLAETINRGRQVDAGVIDTSLPVIPFTPQPARVLARPDLRRARPNPLVKVSTIDFAVDEAGPVSVTIYDSLGRTVRTLVDGALDRGEHAATWDGTRADGSMAVNGVYYCHVATTGGTVTSKVVLMR